LRKQYVSEIKSAKQERLGSNKRPARERLSEKRLVESEATVKHPLMAIIKSLEKYIQTDNRPRNDESFMAIIEQKDREIERLQRELEVAREAEYAVTEDYRALLKILERARSLGITQAAEEDAKPVFKMDANGNLERIG
jgi:prespore-specific regulator